MSKIAFSLSSCGNLNSNNSNSFYLLKVIFTPAEFMGVKSTGSIRRDSRLFVVSFGFVF